MFQKCITYLTFLVVHVAFCPSVLLRKAGEMKLKVEFFICMVSI